jgi:methylmalonyl-CoA mutase C-terminal domain/subunit
MTLFQRVMELLRDRGVDDIVVFGGGIIPDSDIGALRELGVATVFTPGTSTHQIVAWVRANLGEPVEPVEPATEDVPATPTHTGQAG